MFDFNDPSCDLAGKEIKRQTLQEMLEYVATTRGVLTDILYPDVIRMVSPPQHSLNLIILIQWYSLLSIPFDLYHPK